MIFVLHQKWLWIGETGLYHGNNKMKNNYSKNKHCKCGELITNNAKKCSSCAGKERMKNPKKGKKANNYKTGNYCNLHYCIDCGEKISLCSALYGEGRCNSCYRKFNSGKNHHSYIDGRTNKKHYCEDCGEEITSYQHKRCSSCAQKGIHHSHYIDGRSFEKYPQEFNRKLKESIRKRDNHTCQGEGCTMTEEEHLAIYGRTLEVHHIDYNKKNCKEINLITLCKPCNIRANFNRNYWKEYFKEKTLIVRKEK